MSREYQFRAWMNGVMWYTSSHPKYGINGGCIIAFLKNDGTGKPGWEMYHGDSLENSYCVASENNGGILMQYTEQTDSGDNEIYEGDIVEMEGSRAEIGWEEAYTGFYVSPYESDEDEQWCDDWDIEDLGRMELIGNIYENPELVRE